ncbi:MAG: DUF2344 domain-containing protein [Chloroflexi bacterium]|nr:DUF2344 domain-containing protein [Chloroflexota bacterium]
MLANYVQRLRLTFSKTGPTRFIGHLDLARTLERSFNRAKIPIAYTQGFNPRPRMQFAAALPLGYTSECELVDIWLKEALEPEKANQQSMSKIAPGLTVHRVEDVDLKEPALQMQTAVSTYNAALLDETDTAILQQRIADLLAANSHIRVRARKKKNKEYDLRPLIYDLSLTEAEGQAVVHMKLALEQDKNGRPDEVLLALELDPLATRIHRTAIILATQK